MKKPGTPTPGVLGKRTHAQNLQSIINSGASVGFKSDENDEKAQD